MEWRRKKEKQVLWPNCPLQGRHGDWAAARRKRLEMREHNVQSAVRVMRSRTNSIPRALKFYF